MVIISHSSLELSLSACFTRCIVPQQCLHELKGGSYQIRIAGVRNLRQAFSVLEKDAREAAEK